MVFLLELPVEILRLALSHLADSDIRSFLASRSTCKTFETNIKDILELDYSDHGLSIHALLVSYFYALLDSSTVKPIRYLQSLDNLAPIRALPWTSSPETREKWLRREASWRRLPLASATGAIVRQLQVVSIWRYHDEVDQVRGCNVMFPLWTLGEGEGLENDDQALPGGECYFPPHGVTIGWLYDLIVSEGESMGGGWELHFGTKIGDPAEFVEMSRLLSSENRTGSEDEIKSMFKEDKGCALLYEPGGWAPEGEKSADVEAWNPEAIDSYVAQAVPF